MRSRPFVPLLAVAALAALPGNAAASPEDGEGCAGLPQIPASYVCVISVSPENAVPGLGGGGSVGVPVPRVCYVAGCVGPTTVSVPVPGVQPGDGAVAVIWYQGTYIPIAVGAVPETGPLPGIDLGVLDPVVDLVNDPPTLAELLDPYQEELRAIAERIEPIRDLADDPPTPADLLYPYRDELRAIAELVDDPPTVADLTPDIVDDVRCIRSGCY